MRYQPKKFNIQYSAKFSSKSCDNWLHVWLVQPLNNNYQIIKNFSVLPLADRIYNDNQGNKILYFYFKNFHQINIKMDILAELRQSKISLRNKKLFLPNRIIKQRFLKNENFLEQIKTIKNLALNITQDKELLYDKLEVIFYFIVKNFKYCYPINKRGVKNLNLHKLIGDCGEYSSLLVTMLRSLGIPARNQTGYVIDPYSKRIVEHGWASVYLMPVGWLDFDAQYASLEKKGWQKYFCQRSDYRINFINGFNIPLKPNIPKKFLLDDKKKIDTPASYKSVQTLQPLFFASKKVVKFKEKIELVK